MPSRSALGHVIANSIGGARYLRLPNGRVFIALMAMIFELAVAGCSGRAKPPQSPAAPSTTSSRTGTDGATGLDDKNAQSEPGADPSEGEPTKEIDLETIRIEVSGRDSAGNANLEAFDARSLLDDGNEAMDEERFDDAISSYKKLLEVFPDSRLAPLATFNFGAALEGNGEYDGAIAKYRVLAKNRSLDRDSIDAHVRIAAVEAELERWAEARKTLGEVLDRDDLTHADKIEAMARLGYVSLEQGDLAAARAVLDEAIAHYERLTITLESNYFVAMSYYYRAQVSHRELRVLPLRLPDEQLKKDFTAKAEHLARTYDLYREALQIQNAYWATAAGYQMSQIYKEFWDDIVLAPIPEKLAPEARDVYIEEVHLQAKQFLENAMNGHRTNIRLARAYKTSTVWSEASRVRAIEVAEILARESSGEWVKPERKGASLSSAPPAQKSYVPARIDL